MAEGERDEDGAPSGDEMGGVPHPVDLTMPDPRRGDRLGDFEGETDPRVQGEEAADGPGRPASREERRG